MTLPEGLKWLQAGWWLVHVVSVALVYWYGYKKGRESVRREMRIQAQEGSPPPA